MPKVTGPFTVKMTPQALVSPDATRGRFSLDKVYSGAIEGTAVGEMLSGGDYRTGSAGYVAVETVSGSVDGKRGSFLLQHSSTMHAGQQHQSITVIPGTGTDELAGLSGSLVIEIVDGKHTYEFEYALAGK